MHRHQTEPYNLQEHLLKQHIFARGKRYVLFSGFNPSSECICSCCRSLKVRTDAPKIYGTPQMLFWLCPWCTHFMFMDCFVFCFQHNSGFYGHPRSKPRNDFGIEYRHQAKPTPPRLFTKRAQVISTMLSFNESFY